MSGSPIHDRIETLFTSIMDHQAKTPEQDLQEFGKRLAMLLKAADIPMDVKEAIAALVPIMTPEQMDQLAQLLEREVTSGVASDLAELKQSMQAVQDEYEASVKQAQDKAMARMADVQKQIK